MEGLRGRQQDRNHDPGCSRVHPALSASYPARRICAHPAVRLSGEPVAREETGTMPGTARRASRVGEDRYRRKPGEQGRRAGSQTMPGLRDRPHDSDRDGPCDSPGSAVAATGLVMMSQLREAACPPTAFVEAWGDLRPGLVF